MRKAGGSESEKITKLLVLRSLEDGAQTRGSWQPMEGGKQPEADSLLELLEHSFSTFLML